VLDGGRHAVHLGDQRGHIVGEEAAGCLLGVPQVHVDRLVVLLVQSERLAAEAGHPVEHALRFGRHLEHARSVDAVRIAECDERADHRTS